VRNANARHESIYAKVAISMLPLDVLQYKLYQEDMITLYETAMNKICQSFLIYLFHFGPSPSQYLSLPQHVSVARPENSAGQRAKIWPRDT
jgi:hypothetical protein